MKRNRKAAFKDSTAKPLIINDSRFGLRKMYINEKERPSIATYRLPGKGPNGEHQN